MSQSFKLDSLFCSVSSPQTIADGPQGPIPVTRELVLEQPSGDLFGVLQNIAMANTGVPIDPQKFLRPNYMILSTMGGWRSADGSQLALGMHTGHTELFLQVESAARGIDESGGLPFAAYCSDPCDGRTQGTTGMFDSLPYRDDAARVFRRHIRSLPRRKGVVGIGTCDKGLPALMMALAWLRHDKRPGIIVPGGVTLAGRGSENTASVQASGTRLAHGLITLEHVQTEGCRSCASPGGGCQFLGTAATAQVVAEALGMALPHSALMPSGQLVWQQTAALSGKALVSLSEKNWTMADVLTEDALFNAMLVHAAFGGSTNLLLHIAAIAHAGGLRIPSVEDWISVNRLTPRLVSVLPNGPVDYPTVCVWLAGGVPEVMLHLRNVLRLNQKTVAGITLEETLEKWQKSERRAQLRKQLEKEHEISPDQVIFSREKALQLGLTGTLVFPQGNIAPQGSVIKATAIKPNLLNAQGNYEKIGRVKFFSVEADLMAAIKTKKISDEDILVLAGIGPLGTGCQETYQATRALVEAKLSAALLTDGRFSGVSTGACIGHIGPEALAGGPIGKLCDGDWVKIYVDRKELTGAIDLLADASCADVTLGSREIGQKLLDARKVDSRVKPHPLLPEDTKFWALLQRDTGMWKGCVADVDDLEKLLDAGRKVLRRTGET